MRQIPIMLCFILNYNITMNVLNKIKSKKQPKNDPTQKQNTQKPAQTVSKVIQVTVTKESEKMSIEKFPPKRQEYRQKINDRLKTPKYQPKKQQKVQPVKKEKQSFKIQPKTTNYRFRFNSKKGSCIGDTSIFDGELIEYNKSMKEIGRRKVHLSCGTEVISYPQTISSLFLSEAVILGEDCAIIIEEFIIEVMERQSKKRIQM